MNAYNKKYFEVIISDDPEQRRRVAMEENGRFHVVIIEKMWHDTKIFQREQLDLVDDC